MQNLSAFDFDDFRVYLRYRIDRHLKTASGHKRSNLERLARSLGYRSPSLLSMVVKGRRIPSERFVDAVADVFKIKTSERDYLRLLIRLERSRANGKDVSAVLKTLERYGRGKPVHRLSLHEFEAVSAWHVLVLRELIDTPGFREDPLWISKALRQKISPAQARQAIEALLELGMLKREEGTGKLVSAADYTETTHDVPSEAIRLHHRGMMERAMEALEEQPVEKRQYNSLCLRVDPARLAEAKEAVLQFARQFHSEFGSTTSNRIFQMNVQLFEHTKEKEEAPHAKPVG